MLQFASVATDTNNRLEQMSEMSAEMTVQLAELARGSDEILPENSLA